MLQLWPEREKSRAENGERLQFQLLQSRPAQICRLGDMPQQPNHWTAAVTLHVVTCSSDGIYAGRPQEEQIT